MLRLPGLQQSLRDHLGRESNVPFEAIAETRHLCIEYSCGGVFVLRKSEGLRLGFLELELA
jgi:hypothetical protein